METAKWIQDYWQSTVTQNAEKMRAYFAPNALIRWHNTKEQFTAAEFIRANCEYPGNWKGEVERTEPYSSGVITVTHVYAADGSVSFHVVSFIKIAGQKIVELDEYWGEDAPAPQWRDDLQIGTPINP